MLVVAFLMFDVVDELPSLGHVGWEILIFVLRDAIVKFFAFSFECWAVSVSSSVAEGNRSCAISAAKLVVSSGGTCLSHVLLAASCAGVLICLAVQYVVTEFLAFEATSWFRHFFPYVDMFTFNA